MRFLFFLCCISLYWHSNSQIQYTDTAKINPKRFLITNSAIGSIAVSSIIGLQQLWYSNDEDASFHFFDDSKNWLQMDKYGHAMSSYELTRLMNQSYRWSGLSKNKSMILSASISFGYLSAIEIMDGFSPNWGFSWSDMGANLMGTSFIFISRKILLKANLSA
ncbi:MAG: DUF2279 domain-containing protein [Crocinitomicaceae bacterium]